MTKPKKRLKVPQEFLDSVVFECLGEEQKFILGMLWLQAAQSPVPGVLLVPFDAFQRFTAYNIIEEDLKRTLYALQTHNFLGVSTFERFKCYFVEIMNWENFAVVD